MKRFRARVAARAAARQSASGGVVAFSPLSISGCVVWLDGGDNSTMNSTTAVTQWRDKSGQSNTMTGSGTWSGGKMVFNGSTNAFSNTGFVFPYASYSLFAVYSNTTAPASTAYMNVAYGSNGFPMIGVYDSKQHVTARSVVGNTGALTTSANAGWALQISGNGWDCPRSCCVDSTDQYLYIVGDTGSYPTTTYSNAGGGIGAVTSNSSIFMLAKYSTDGILIWVAPNTSTGYGFGCVNDPSGNVFFAGTFWGSPSIYRSVTGGATVSLTTPAGGDGACLGKYSSDGTVQWVAGISSSNQDDCRAISLDGNGNVYACGQYAATCTFNSAPAIGGPGLVLPFGGGQYEGFLVKYSPNGTLIWATHMATSGGTGTLPATVLADSNGNVYIASYYAGGSLTLYNATLSNGTSVGGGPVTIPISSGANTFLAKYSSSGSNLWAVQIAGPSGNASGIVFDSAGNIVVNVAPGSGSTTFNSATGSGGTSTTITTSGNALAKYSPTGSNIWAVPISGYGLGTDSAGNFYTAAAKYSPTGSNVWSASTNGAYGMTADSKGNSYRVTMINVAWNAYNADGTVGAAFTIKSGDQYDAFAVKYSPAGFITSSPVLASSNVIVGTTYSPSTALIPYTNGVSMTALSGTVAATTGLYLGGSSNYFNGTLSELVVFSNALSSSQRQQMEGYLAWKWGLQSSLPGSHVFRSVAMAASNATLASPLYYDVTPADWTQSWQPYLQSLATANAGAVATFSSNVVTGYSSPSNGAYESGVLGPNGKIYCIPSTAASVGVIDTVTNTFSTPVSGTSSGGYANVGGVLAPNGKIYCVPAGATAVGVIDPVANTFTTFGTAPGNDAYLGGVLAPNGKIYCIPANATSVGVIDPVAGTFTTPVSGTCPGSYAYLGGVLAPNGKIYCTPFGATSVGVIDPVANTFTTFGSAPGNSAYATSVLAPNGKIYCAPAKATSIGVIDPVAGTFTTTTVTGTVTGTGAGNYAYYSGVLGPDGKIYCIPTNATSVGVIDPVANTFTTFGTSPGSQSHIGGTLAPNGKIYCIPLNGTFVGVISFTGLSQLPSSNYCLSAWTNKL